MFARPNELIVWEVEAVVDSIVLQIFEHQSVAVAVAFAAVNDIAAVATVNPVEQ